MSRPTDTASIVSRARQGDLGALTVLGKRLLVGDGVNPAPVQGVEMLREASLRGHAEAAVMLSVCAAWGVGQSRDISGALDHLRHAAERGERSAQRQLQLLAREVSNDWARLRRIIDVTSWTASPAARQVVDRPRIIVIEGFASAEECDWLIERGQPALKRALVYREGATAREAESRTNSEASFTIFHADVVLNLLRDRMSAATGAASALFEVTKLLHYEPGQQFALHADFLQVSTPEMAQEVALRGQRAATLLVYLNEDFEGGETDFPRIGYRYKGRRGDALLFSNLDPAGEPDYDTVHAGLPPSSGEKWLLSQWIRTRPVVR